MCKTESSRAKERPAAAFIPYLAFRFVHGTVGMLPESQSEYSIYFAGVFAPRYCVQAIYLVERGDAAPNWSRNTLAREQCVQRSPCVLLHFPYRPMGSMCINRPILNRPLPRFGNIATTQNMPGMKGAQQVAHFIHSEL